MAIMIPSNPLFDNGGNEDIIYNSLKKLPDDWYVIHSLHIKDFNKRGNERELDFTVFVPNQGIVVIEAKSGAVRYSDVSTYYGNEYYPPYTWLYESGKKMNGHGPFAQVRNAMYDLKDYIEDSEYHEFAYRLKYYTGVWFFSMSTSQINQINFPPNGDKESTLCKDDLIDPYNAIMKLINHQNKTGATRQKRDHKRDKLYGDKPLNKKEYSILINKKLSPCLNIVPSKHWLIDIDKIQLNELLKEQVNILNYLEEQNTAVICGGAGTGKTMIALEKARRESEKGNHVLFLCFNKLLNDHLSKNFAYKNVDFYTIDGLCKDLVTVLDLNALKEYLEDNMESIKYNVIIIDEAQDFGIKRTDESKIIELLSALMELKNGQFYLFYDKNQNVHSDKIPSYIENADCKLTLYRNCRNTTQIAKTSYSVLPKKPKVLNGFKNGEPPSISFVTNDKIEKLNKALDELINEGFDNITILTVKSENESFLNGKANQNTYIYRNKKIKFTTCKKFKGLESDAIILIDVDKKTLTDVKEMEDFYVGTSRAILRLIIITNLLESEALEVASNLNKDQTNLDGLPDKYALLLVLSAIENNF